MDEPAEGLSMDEDIKEKINRLRDPETQLGAVLSSLLGKEESPLTETQREQLTQLMENRKKKDVNWHDVRNIIRMHADMAMWDYAISHKPDVVALKKDSWLDWNNLLLDYMKQEYIEKEDYQKQAWDILTAEQKKQLLDGEFDSWIKKHIGHLKKFSAHKQVTKFMKKPTNQAGYDKVTKEWEEKWKSVQSTILKAREFQRKREFARDLYDTDFSTASWEVTEKAFRNFALAEGEAIREITQASYGDQRYLKKKVDGYREQLSGEMVERYGDGAEDFLKVLGIQ